MKKITIIVPCYNEEASISLFYNEVVKYIDYPNYDIDMLYVNDGSKDGTLNEIRKLAETDERVKYISLSRNFGKEAAMHAGLEKCVNNDAIIFIDADLQHPPYLIKDMIKYWEEGFKLIYAKHKSRKGEGLIKRFFAKSFYKLFESFSNIKLESGVKDFQLLDKRVIDAYLKLKDNNRFVKGIFSWVGFEKKCLPFDYVPRQVGKTSWSFKKLFKYGFNGINQFSSFLLLIPLLFGVVVFILACIDLAVCFTNNYLSQGAMAVWAYDQLKNDLFMIIILVLFYFAFYLIYNTRAEVIKRPIYIIDEDSSDGVRDEKNN